MVESRCTLLAAQPLVTRIGPATSFSVTSGVAGGWAWCHPYREGAWGQAADTRSAGHSTRPNPGRWSQGQAETTQELPIWVVLIKTEHGGQ